MPDLKKIDNQLRIMAALAEGKRKPLSDGRWITVRGRRIFIPKDPSKPVIGPAWFKRRNTKQ